MKYTLVSSRGDWGDELNLEGFGIYTKELWEEKKSKIPDEPHEVYYGSNEFVTFENREEVLSYLTEVEITGDEFEVLKKLLGLSNWSEFYNRYGMTYGLFPIK